MTELLTAVQMRAIEQAAIESGAVTGLELMQRAGQGVVEAVFEEWPELAEGTHRAVVLCGPGNNGGDGFVVARLLKARGWTVEVFLYGDPAKLPPDAKVNYSLWCAVGDVMPAGALSGSIDIYDFMETEPDLFVDALFGTGLSRPLSHETRGRIELGEDPDDIYQSEFDVWSEVPTLFDGEEHQLRTVAIDVPSGHCSDSGRAMGVALRCDLCVTFHSMKRCHVLSDCIDAIGKTVVVNIGLRTGHGPWKMPNDVRSKLPKEGYAATAGAQIPVKSVVPKQTGNKFSHGHALILSGGSGRTGAARLAARGALRIGAGLVTLGVPPAAQMEVAAQITALMLQRVAHVDALVEALEDTRINALCLGPGLGLDERAASLVDCVLNDANLSASRRAVFDADALTLIAADPARMGALSEHAVLTPHGGEFARLFPDIAERLASVPDTGPAYSKVDATRDAAKRCGAVVLFKGPDTVIANPGGRSAVHAAAYAREAPWLATAGAGDVLAGFITGLLARGFDPMTACETAAWLHVECARAFGPGLIAEDLPEMLPQVLRALES